MDAIPALVEHQRYRLALVPSTGGGGRAHPCVECRPKSRPNKELKHLDAPARRCSGIRSGFRRGRSCISRLNWKSSPVPGLSVLEGGDARALDTRWLAPEADRSSPRLSGHGGPRSEERRVGKE